MEGKMVHGKYILLIGYLDEHENSDWKNWSFAIGLFLWSDLETVKESRKIWNFHFDLHLLPTFLILGTLLCCQETGIISQRPKTANEILKIPVNPEKLAEWNSITWWIIMHEKCGHPDFNVFYLKWIFGTHCNWKIKILVAVLELPAKQHFQSSPFTTKMGQMGWIGSVV